MARRSLVTRKSSPARRKAPAGSPTPRPASGGRGWGTALAAPGRQVYSYEDLLAAESSSFEWPELDEKSAAAMCYTSGTTGRPKGVVYSHRSTYLHSMGAC